MVLIKYARILLFQFVFTKYVFVFRNYDGLTFVVFVVFYKNVFVRNYDKNTIFIQFLCVITIIFGTFQNELFKMNFFDKHFRGNFFKSYKGCFVNETCLETKPLDSILMVDKVFGEGD